MKRAPKWLLIPPAVAALLILGPLSMQGSAATFDTRNAAAQEPGLAPGATPTERVKNGTIAAPRSPDLLQMASTLAGVLLLGVGGIMLLRKLRGGATPTRGATLATLRQTLRLSGRQALHAIEFDDRILLVGEHERGLVLLDSGKLQDRLVDEAEVLARTVRSAAESDAPADDGATPRNLVIPRPDHAPAHRPAVPPATRLQSHSTAGLNDFRTLLRKAGRA